MNTLEYIKKHVSSITLIISMVLFMLSLLINTRSGDTEQVAMKTSQRLEKRIGELDRYMDQAIKSDHSQWLSFEDFPEDMVIYRYVYDTLQSWCNQFPVINDDIGSRMLFNRLSNLRGGLTSQLAEITEKPCFINLGTKWYLAKAATDDVNCRVIGGLEIKDNIYIDLRKSSNGVNHTLQLPGKFSVHTLDYTGGSPVYLGRTPMFKIIGETVSNVPVLADSLLRWLALILFTVSIVLRLWIHRSLKVYIVALVILLCMTVIAYLWGTQMQSTSSFFSPSIYADGRLFHSLGVLIIVNTYIFLYILCTYLTKNQFLSWVLRQKRNRPKLLYPASLIALTGAVLFYMHYSLKSIVMNSSISLELYVWNSISFYTLIVYISYIGLLIGVLMLLQMLSPALKALTGIRYNVLSKKFLLGYAAVCALYFTITAGVLGFQKEQNRVIVWTNRLAIDRDLGLELNLRSVEEEIANDPLISTLAGNSNSSDIILNRLNENYFNRISQDYEIAVSTCRDSDPSRSRAEGEVGYMGCLDYFNQKLSNGAPISDNSRFFYSYNNDGTSSYTGMFIYYSQESGVVRLFVEIESKAELDGSGYHSILANYTKPGEVYIPSYYSYAKFIRGKLVSYKGNYAYPTVMDEGIEYDLTAGEHSHFKVKGYVHFANIISNDEMIIVSRPIHGAMTYLVTFSYLILFIYCILLIITSKRPKKKTIFRKNYFKSSINTVLFCALFFTLVSMAAVSVTFVYNRNEQNMYNMMSDKISTIQALLESRCRYASSYRDLGTQDFSAYMENVAQTTKSDVSIYTPGGKVFKSTSPEIFSRMILGTRIDKEAYYNIRYRNQRFYIQKAQIAGHKYYSLYAPIFNAKGSLIAIVCSPYTDGSYDFTRDALFHAATIVNLFFILLIATIIASTTVVNSMFRPLIEMGQKMSSADLHGLEYIIYKRNDEISVLVDAYNRMVHDLSDSSRQLAQAERDKAWSEMARQVAHEIKNPLTPIKLEIQRLIRLKQKNDPSWSEKFDKVSAVVLEHIDILTDTANEFSTFAKLYSEEPVLIDLDKTLRDQLVIFDNKENIEISYIGLENASVMAPKPQLIRVFVNLITNAIQAIEIQQKENAEDGRPVTEGKILICLRNSIKDGFYDAVFEDNGPGVKEENLNKLFTPNFTTKSAGTGLGLAICRNIIEKCNGEILYQKSFGLKGACFTVRLPKYTG